MWGKFYESTFTGSMFGAGATTFAVWGYIIANCHGRSHTIELNARVLAATIGENVETIEAAIEYLCAPDPRSRSKAEDGRRLIREGEYLYRVVNHERYSVMRNDDERREYNRVKQQEHRARKASEAVKPLSQVGQPRSAHVDVDVEKDSCAPKTGAHERERNLYPDDFEAFYALYPKKRNKGDALKAWKAIAKPRPSLGALEAALQVACTSQDWLKDGGQFVPYPATWLRARGWEDESPTPAGDAGSEEPPERRQFYAEAHEHSRDPNWTEYEKLVTTHSIPVGWDAFLRTKRGGA